jgi:hypothetical protein
MADFSDATWRKSTYSVNNGCVEVAFVDGQVAVRDSKNPSGPVLLFSEREWTAFVDGVRTGEFDQALAPRSPGRRVGRRPWRTR